MTSRFNLDNVCAFCREVTGKRREELWHTAPPPPPALPRVSWPYSPSLTPCTYTLFQSVAKCCSLVGKAPVDALARRLLDPGWPPSRLLGGWWVATILRVRTPSQSFVRSTRSYRVQVGSGLKLATHRNNCPVCKPFTSSMHLANDILVRMLFSHIPCRLRLRPVARRCVSTRRSLCSI